MPSGDWDRISTVLHHSCHVSARCLPEVSQQHEPYNLLLLYDLIIRSKKNTIEHKSFPVSLQNITLKDKRKSILLFIVKISMISVNSN